MHQMLFGSVLTHFALTAGARTLSVNTFERGWYAYGSPLGSVSPLAPEFDGIEITRLYTLGSNSDMALILEINGASSLLRDITVIIGGTAYTLPQFSSSSWRLAGLSSHVFTDGVTYGVQVL